jgi:hypothetical protein
MATKNTTSADEDARRELAAAAPANTIDGAFGPNWDKWQNHVKATAAIDEETGTPTVPLLVYGEGPHDYISTDFDAGEVMVRDGNDRTGRAWKFAQEGFVRYIKRLRGEDVDEEQPEKGDNPLVAAGKLAERTARSVQRDHDAERAAGRGDTPGKVDRAGSK